MNQFFSLHFVIELIRHVRKTVFDGDNLTAQAVSFFVAGFEATSTTIAFALYDLSNNPIYEAQAYEEIIRIAGEKEFTMEMLNEMTFLEKCINESLRLNPPLPIADRVSVRDYQVNEEN